MNILSKFKGFQAGSFLHLSILNFLAQALWAALMLLTQVLIARWLGPEKNGVYNLAVLIVTLSFQFVNMGIGTSNVYFTGNRQFPLSAIVGNSLILSAGLTFLTIAVFPVLVRMEGIQTFLDKNHLTSLQLGIAVLSVPVYTCLIFLNNVLLGQERITAYNSVNIIRSFLQLLLLVILQAILVLDIEGALWSYFVATCAAVLLNAWLIWQATRYHFMPHLPLLRASITYGIRAYLGNLMQFLSYRINVFFVAYFLGVKEVSYYTIALVMAESLWLISGSIGTVLFPRVSALGKGDANRLTSRVTRHVLFAVSCIAIGLAVFARPLIQLVFGSSYLPAVPVLLWLLPGVVVLSIPKILSHDLAGRGHPELGATSAFFAFITSLPVNWFLIPLWGLKGAAFASTIGYTTAAIVVVFAFCRLTQISWLDTVLIKPSDFRLYGQIMSQTFRIRTERG